MTIDAGLGAVATANARAGHGCRGHQCWSFREQYKIKKEIQTYLPGAEHKVVQTKRMISRAFQACLTSTYTSIAVGTAQEDLLKCQTAQTYLPEVQYHAWGSQKGPRPKQIRRTRMHVHGALRRLAKA